MKLGVGTSERGIEDSLEESWEGWPPPGSIVRIGEGRFSKEVEVVRLHRILGKQRARVRMWYFEFDEPDIRRPLHMNVPLSEMEILSVPPESIGKADWRRGLV